MYLESRLTDLLPSAARYESRTVQWGHWGITFMDAQPDRSKNYGVIAGNVHFPVGARGPVDSRPGDRQRYQDMCAAWISDRVIPAGFVPSADCEGVRPKAFAPNLTGLIAWLRTQDPAGEYTVNCAGICLFGKFHEAMGIPYVVSFSSYGNKKGLDELYPNAYSIAAGFRGGDTENTFGAALHRALQSSGRV